MPAPNILFVVCDQMAAQLIGAYGHPVCKTPNLDALARRGIRFDAAYTPCPICAPARQCMASGQFTSSNGCYDNGACLTATEPCYPHYLTGAGYDVVLSGKMHFVGPDQLHGYRARFMHNIYPSDFRWSVEREYAGKRFPQMNIPQGGDWVHAYAYTLPEVRPGEWHPALAYDEETHLHALNYLRAASERLDKPWCLTVSYHHPHEPWRPRTEDWELYDGLEIPTHTLPADLRDRESQMDRWLNEFHGCDEFDLQRPEALQALYRAYYAQCTYIDAKLGELMSELDARGLAENTIVVFTSDHGDMLGARDMVQKRTFYEQSSRVPLIVAFPDGRHAGDTRQAPVNLIDLLPTFCDWGGVDRSDLCRHDGESLVDVIESDQPDRATFCEMHTDGVYAPCFMVRKGRFKLNLIHGHRGQLFDLESDPDEWNNLIDDPVFASKRVELERLILDRFDPEAIEAEIQENVKRRRLIQRANVENDVDWDARPSFDHHRNDLDKYLP